MNHFSRQRLEMLSWNWRWLSADLECSAGSSGKGTLAKVDWRCPAVEPIRQAEIKQLCVSVFFIRGSNILWVGVGSVAHSQSLGWVAKATHYASFLFHYSSQRQREKPFKFYWHKLYHCRTKNESMLGNASSLLVKIIRKLSLGTEWR